jgi:hypothetical protein
MRRKLLLLASFAIAISLSAVPSLSQQCGVRCGTERWKVKSLTDSTVDLVDFDPVEKSINWLRIRARPHSLPNTKRLIGSETMTFRVRGVVLKHRLEDHCDFHVVIAQSNNHARTMIAEFPDIACSNVCSSEFADQVRQARADFVAKFGNPTTSFTTLDDPMLVEVEGVGFFDWMHGQRGRGLPAASRFTPY